MDFEDLALGAKYAVGDSFVDSGVITMTGTRFHWYGGGFTDGGRATIQNDGEAGSSGRELWTNNINIIFDFGGACTDLTLRLGEYGGNCNIAINGFVIGGVEVSFSQIAADENGYRGVLTLTGRITSFSIGGQEFVIDDVQTKRS